MFHGDKLMNESLEIIPLAGCGHLLGTYEVSLMNWKGQSLIRFPGRVFHFNRKTMNAVKTLAEMKQCGVYLLFGTTANDKNEIQKNIYVGQANLRKNGEAIYGRINEHDTPAEAYWTEAIVFIDRGKRWSGTAISYLENRIATLVKKAKGQSNRYIIQNKNEPNIGYIPEDTIDKMEQYLDGFVKIIQIMGYDFFEKEDDPEPVLPGITMGKDKTPLPYSNKKNNNNDLHPSTQQQDNGKHELQNSACFPFKIGQVMAFAFREALATGRLNAQIKFLESEDASKLFKTRGNRVIVSGGKPSRDSGGRNRFAKKPVLFGGKTYWITTQVWADGLCNLLSFLEQHGMSRKEVEAICQKSGEKSQQNSKARNHIQIQYKSYYDYLLKTMCKSSASNYASAFRVLNAMLIKNNIIAFSLSNTIASHKLEEIKTYISSDKTFLAYNKQHHYSYSATFRKYLEYLDVCNDPTFR